MLIKTFIDDSADERQEKVVIAGAFMGRFGQWTELKTQWRRRLRREARIAGFAVRVFSRHDVPNYCSVAPCQSCGVLFFRTDISSSLCARLLGVQS
jgi:hypothetical protein